MSKIQSLSEPWDGLHTGDEIEDFLKDKLQKAEDKVGGIRVNSQMANQDVNGVVDLNIPVVDSSLNEQSSNPVENGAVSVEINRLKNKSVSSMRTEETGDGETLRLVLENENGDEVSSCRIPKASDGSSQAYARVTTAINKSRIKQGDSVVLTWSYNHLNGDGTPTGRAADTIVIRAVNGTTEVFRETLNNVADNTTRQIVLGPDVLTAGMVGIYVQATVIDDDGTEQKAQGYKSVQVVTINLSSAFSPASQLALTNGFTDEQMIDVTYTITGPKGNTVYLFVDGQQSDSATINTSSTTVGHFYIPASSLEAGRHNLQLVAESDGLLSSVIYMDLLKAGGTTPYLGLKMVLDADDMDDLPLGYDGNGDEESPVISAEQFSELAIEFAAWHQNSVTSQIAVLVKGVQTQLLSVDRTLQTLTQRFDTAETATLTLALGDEKRELTVVVSAAEGIDEQEASDYVLKLSANGRSNLENNPAEWGGVATFKNMDWSTNGWLKKDGVDTLALTNGASVEVDYQPFVLTNEYSVERTGMTVEMEIMVSQVLQRGYRIVSCLDGSPALGFDVTSEEAALHLGQMQNIVTAEKDENDQTIIIQRELGVAMNIASDKWMKIAFVVQPSVDGQRKTFLFINGVLSKANQYEQGLSFVQSSPKGISFTSDKADVYIRSMRIYRRALSHSEILGNYIIDRPTAVEIQSKHNNNATSREGSNMPVDPTTLIEKGKGVLIIIRSDDSGTGLTDVYTTNNKKTDFNADYIRFYSPLGRDYDFEAYNVYIRIQGTSSVKYPWKNIRIYLTKGPKTQEKPFKLVIGGEDVTSNAKGYALRGSNNSIVQSVLCAKTDFVDSSMVLNTGGAILFDNIMRSMNLLTPPQSYDNRVRQAIDGIPCDMFCGTSLQGTLTYYGQFNLNNEKSKSGKIFGMEGVSGFTPTCPIALEALDNGSPMTLFQVAGTAGSTALENQLEAEFDKGFEFNFPEDTFYSQSSISDPVKESVASYDQKQAIRRWMGWLYDCFMSTVGVQGGTMSAADPDYGTKYGWSDESKAKWVCTKFKNEAANYFNVNHLLCYYIFTDYHASVDQRAKNILWRTWDGLKWYATYYDGDTAHSIRNDAFMAYLYNVTRDTWDDERSKYAFEGHNSWLWCLVLANFEDELRQQAANLRGTMTLQAMLTVFNETMMGNWSERQYNESGMLKYVDTMARQNYVYTLTGNREAHRTAFLTDRSQLLDARYATGNFQADYVGIRVGREVADAADVFKIVSNDLYYFGWKLSNGSWRQGPLRAEMDDNVNLSITGKLSSANDPLAVCGASRMKEIDLTGMNGHLAGDFDLSRCTMLSKLVANSNSGANIFNGVIMSLGNISKLEYIDITGQISMGTNQAGTTLDITRQTKLQTLLCGDTHLTQVLLPEGAPLTTLVLPDTTSYLSLRYLPNLTRAGLTIQGFSNIRQFIFSNCPKLDWQALLDECTNVEYIRVEGVSGRVRASFLERYIGKNGYDADGNPVTFPALTGKVFLTEVISISRLQTLRDTFRYLDIVECQYSQYTFNDEEIDPANITNEDNKTGYDYLNSVSYPDVSDDPAKYTPSGHISIIHDRCQPCAGLINPVTGKMQVTRLSKSNLGQTVDGATFNLTDPNGEMYDIFLYVPHYWYKGVNDYKNAKKHFFLSSKATVPDSSATVINRYNLGDCLFEDGKGIDNRIVEVGQNIANAVFSTVLNCAIYKVDVQNMKLVRFPGFLHSYYSHAFVDKNGEILKMNNLSMQDISVGGTVVNPADFDNEIGDYDFREVPENAKFLYFTCNKNLSTDLEIIATDSLEIESMEPDWVEHLPEFIGLYSGSATGLNTGGTPTTGLRSLSGKQTARGNGTSITSTDWNEDANGNPTTLPSSSINGTAQDFFNLARIRNAQNANIQGEYTTVPFETSKNMANLFMVWFGTRDVESKVGMGGTSSFTTGLRNNVVSGDTNASTMSAASSSNTNQLNKMWWIEAWTGSVYEWTDNGCFNAPSFKNFLKAKRVENVNWSDDHFYNILMQDGTERRVKCAYDNHSTNVARVRFGRFCDIVASAFAGDNAYATMYSCYQSCGPSSGSRKGRVLGRSNSSAYAYASVAFSFPHYASTVSYSYYGGRLCFFGDIENEDVLLD